jgi:hypothetical protein
MTVGIVDAYDDPNAESDLAAYRTQWGLLPCTTANGCFQKLDENGGTNYPPTDPGGPNGWAVETSLDLDAVSAMCETCHIVLVEATTDSSNDLYSGVTEAVNAGAGVISLSWGGSEYSSETLDDSVFNNPGVAIMAASGDSGYAGGVSYPAASPYVTAVGGTRLVQNASSRGFGETVWNGTGSGCSHYEPKPAWQAGVTDASCSKRMLNDVSADGDPNTGLAIFDSYGQDPTQQWMVVGGTSLSTPLIAGIYAVAGGEKTGTTGAHGFYSDWTLNDVTSGNNGTCGGTAYYCNAETGYDGPTGRGTPAKVPVTVTPYQMIFASQAFGSTVATQTAIDWNNQPSTSTTVTASISGPQAADFSATPAGNCAPLAAASNCHITVHFAPSAPGAESATLTLSDTSSSGAHVIPLTGSSFLAGSYVPITPFRVLDTRNSSCVQCNTNGRFGPGSIETLQVTGVGSGNIPSTAIDVVLNVTAVSGTQASYITMYPTGSALPGTSNLNFPPNTNLANLVQVRLGPAGQVNIYNNQGNVDMVIDAEGYFAPTLTPSTPSGPGLFHAITPVRLCDTRGGQGTLCNNGTDNPLGPGQARLIQLAGHGGVPAAASGAATVAINLTAVSGTMGTFLSVYPASGSTCGAPPNTSTLNVGAATNLANRAMAVSSATGNVCVYNSMGTINLVIDATGWFGDGTESSVSTGDYYYPMTPVRLCDTRAGTSTECTGTQLAQHATLTVTVAGVDGIPSTSAPDPPVAIVANVTAVSGSEATFFTIYPTGISRPTASDINVSANTNLPNLCVVPLGTGGAITLYNDQGTYSAVVDVNGWYAE